MCHAWWKQTGLVTEPSAMKKRRRLLLAALTLAGVCATLALVKLEFVAGNDQTKEKGTSAGEPAQVAKDAVLTVADLPAGWVAATSEPDDSDDPGFSEACRILSSSGFPEDTARAESEDLYGPLGQKVNSNVSVFLNDDAADEAFMLVRNLERCQVEFELAVKDLLSQQAGNNEKTASVAASFYPIDLPAAPAQSVGYRLETSAPLDSEILNLVFDFIWIRRGSLVGNLIYTSFDGIPDYQDELMLLGIASDNLSDG
jgi:hypothetical protein